MIHINMMAPYGDIRCIIVHLLEHFKQFSNFLQLFNRFSAFFPFFSCYIDIHYFTLMSHTLFYIYVTYMKSVPISCMWHNANYIYVTYVSHRKITDWVVTIDYLYWLCLAQNGEGTERKRSWNDQKKNWSRWENS